MTEANFSVVSRCRDQIDTVFIQLFSNVTFPEKKSTTERLEQQNYFLQVEAKSFFILIYRGPRPVAKAAIFISDSNSDIAYLGCYELENSEQHQHISRLLLQEAVAWADSLGVKKIYGPMDRNSWYQNRVRTDLDARSFSWEPRRNPSLLTDWQAFGFKVDRRYASYAFKGRFWFNLWYAALAFAPAYIFAKLKGFRVQPMEHTWTDNLPDIYRLAMKSFAGAHLFEAIEFDEFELLYGKLGAFYDLSPSFFLLDPKGERIGFILAFYHQDYLIVKTLGITPSWQGLGLARSLICFVWYTAARAGYKLGVAALIRSGNSSEFSTKFVQKFKIFYWLHEYELLVYHLEEARSTPANTE